MIVQHTVRSVRSANIGGDSLHAVYEDGLPRRVKTAAQRHGAWLAARDRAHGQVSKTSCRRAGKKPAGAQARNERCDRWGTRGSAPAHTARSAVTGRRGQQACDASRLGSTLLSSSISPCWQARIFPASPSPTLWYRASSGSPMSLPRRLATHGEGWALQFSVCKLGG